MRPTGGHRRRPVEAQIESEPRSGNTVAAKAHAPKNVQRAAFAARGLASLRSEIQRQGRTKQRSIPLANEGTNIRYSRTIGLFGINTNSSEA
jgi:hypothetical protein